MEETGSGELSNVNESESAQESLQESKKLRLNQGKDETSRIERFLLKDLIVSIGWMETIFNRKNGTPRQSGICPESRGIVRLHKGMFNNAFHCFEGINEFEYVCEEEVPVVPLASYGAPEPEDPIPSYGVPRVADPSPEYGVPAAPVIAATTPKSYGDKIRNRARGKRQTWPPHPGLDGLFIGVNHDQVRKNKM